MRNFVKEFYSPTKTQGLCNKVDTFVQLPMETIEEALEHFNEYMRAKFLEWHIDFRKRRMGKMEIWKEAKDLKLPRQDPHARSVRSTAMSKVNPELMQVRRFKIWFLFVHN
jgi:hypothetical protein